MYEKYECFVMQMLYVCVLCASCGCSQCCILHDLHHITSLVIISKCVTYLIQYNYFFLFNDFSDDYQAPSKGIVLSAKKSVERISRLKRTQQSKTKTSVQHKGETRKVVDQTATTDEETVVSAAQ